MSFKLVKVKFSSHWSDFLEAVDKQLETPVALHCIGGFVVEVVYEIPRRTADWPAPILWTIQKEKIADLG